MNEYTRREEVRWTLVAAAVLVICIGAGIVLLMTAQGPIVQDPTARAAAVAAEARASRGQSCVVVTEKLEKEIELFRETAKTARLSAQEPDAGVPKGRNLRIKVKEKPPDVELAWASAQGSYRQAKVVTAATCRDLVEGVLPARAETTPGWQAITTLAELTPPAEGDKPAQAEATRKLLVLMGGAPIDKVVQMTKDAAASLKTTAEAERKRAESALTREALPKGLLPREAAIIIGVGLCLASMLLSYLSLRVVSVRRAATLMPLRQTSQPGVQAAAILKLAAQHNGGEPGIVVGAAAGGLAAALLRPADADLFVIGVMGGLLLGLGAQWLLRLALGASSWRRRSTELGEIEKPQIPIVLVLSGVNKGLEAQFLSFFASLAPIDAAVTVQKLAYQAEEKILLAAEAGAAAAAASGAGYRPSQPGSGAGGGR